MRRLGIFAKFWQPGRVKTRLAADIGPHAAARLYRGFLETLLTRLHRSAPGRDLVFAPRERRAAFAALVSSTARRLPARAGPWRLVAQGGGDLGRRMDRYFSAAFRGGARRVVLIGSDSPTLPTDYIEEAFDRLADVPVVLGPSDDGGYYLVAARDRVPPIFEGMAWSTPDLWDQTTERLRRQGIAFASLARWYDVDELADLRRLHRELQAVPHGPHGSIGPLKRQLREQLRIAP